MIDSLTLFLLRMTLSPIFRIDFFGIFSQICSKCRLYTQSVVSVIWLRKKFEGRTNTGTQGLMMSRITLFALVIVISMANVNANAASSILDDALGMQSSVNSQQIPAAPKIIPSGKAAEPAPPIEIASPQNFDYRRNLESDVFGANLFSGAFARQGATQFNPDYLVTVGDRLQVRLWGAFDFDSEVVVDPQGNVFLPHVGPIRVMGTRNRDLQKTVDIALRKVFRNNVYSYASLAAAQPVRVFVSGFVHRPGLYNGTSMDSLLHYLDQAGGIDPERGSFLRVQVKRNGSLRGEVNLYDFLLKGNMPQLQLADGDVIFVAARQNTVAVRGLAENAKRFEFSNGVYSVADLIALAKPRAQATHVRVLRNTGTVRNVEYFPLEQAGSIALANGDELEFTADKKPGTITVRVEGEHDSPQEYVLPYGTRLGELQRQIRFTDRSDVDSIQLFRLSVQERQKQMLETSLKSLETTALTARSGTSDEARLRKDEADLILQWVDRAKKIEPPGQVMISQASSRDQILLENGDVLRVPAKDGLVLVSGEVLFPNAIAYDASLDLEEYIQRAGGYTQNADASRVVVAHRDGSFTEGNLEDGWFGAARNQSDVRAGDEILVLPKIDVKSRQIAKDLTQILYQIAVSAKVVFGL
ncbi:MAG TPA: polysaccharide biosynthesis/export family protein [Nitrospira sp.]|uniref:polysaccharide biosynthesis/export family protein n=1 Tax=Cognatazoarcus halotolerans TaxID=2686016 RepID=UPI00190F9DD7|nr:polysaccharide biosynthesis/export family protein [Cognatazoarcus halotolerans]MCB1902104.1 polysaccharide biosynthesis/export family protein [Rhodocyclaceae bacterium]HQV11202.1 polysaccharide biosynthesis/export family protein [Nitrospira sp.]